MSLDSLVLLPLSPPADGSQSGGLFQFIPLIAVFVIFYVVVFAPMRKRQKQHGEMLGQLKPGDHVITNGGIHGTVAGVTDDVVLLKITDSVKIEVSKSAISALRELTS